MPLSRQDFERLKLAEMETMELRLIAKDSSREMVELLMSVGLIPAVGVQESARAYQATRLFPEE
jgi:hypothetical protein